MKSCISREVGRDMFLSSLVILVSRGDSWCSHRCQLHIVHYDAYLMDVYQRMHNKQGKASNITLDGNTKGKSKYSELDLKKIFIILKPPTSLPLHPQFPSEDLMFV